MGASCPRSAEPAAFRCNSFTFSQTGRMELFPLPRVGMVMTMVRDLLLYIGAVLLCAPLLIYLLDSIIGLGRLDPLTLSTTMGGIGACLCALSQGQHWGRFAIALIIGLALLALQVYGIAFLVLQTSGL